MRSCPFCGRPLRGLLVDGKPGVRCTDEECVFNFQDQTCPQCGAPAERVLHPHPSQYVIFCANNHEWVVS